jgi:hypothetical protein
LLSYQVYRVELSITILREYTQCKPKMQPKITKMGRPPKLEGSRARDITPTVVRLVPEVRAALLRESHISGRSLSAEIALRLARSLEGPQGGLAGEGLAAHEGAAPYAPKTLAVNDPEAAAQGPELTGEQRLMLRLYSGLSPEKQLALLTLLRR